MARYTDTDKAQALAKLEMNGGNVKKTARELGMPHSTLILWRRHAVEAGDVSVEAVTLQPTNWTAVREKAGNLYLNNARLAAGIVRDNLEQLKGQELSLGDTQRVAVIQGISADKAYDLLFGRRGGEFNVAIDNRRQNVLANIPSAALEALIAQADREAEERSAQDGGEVPA